MSTLTHKRSGRSQYLVTYSQADSKRFPTRESFGQMLEREFNDGRTVVKVKHWACCRELHQNGTVAQTGHTQTNIAKHKNIIENTNQFLKTQINV